jgi:hypothetical protein
VGVRPDPNFEPANLIFNLKTINASGTAVTDNRPSLAENNKSMEFTQPLDVAVHPSGRIYVADFGQWSRFGKGGAIWTLDPHP